MRSVTLTEMKCRECDADLASAGERRSGLCEVCQEILELEAQLEPKEPPARAPKRRPAPPIQPRFDDERTEVPRLATNIPLREDPLTDLRDGDERRVRRATEAIVKAALGLPSSVGTAEVGSAVKSFARARGLQGKRAALWDLAAVCVRFSLRFAGDETVRPTPELPPKATHRRAGSYADI